MGCEYREVQLLRQQWENRESEAMNRFRLLFYWDYYFFGVQESQGLIHAISYDNSLTY